MFGAGCFSPATTWDHTPRWSSDGRRLVFLGADFLNRDRTLAVRDTLSGSISRISTSDRQMYDSVWSPDGTRIAFVESGSSIYVHYLYLVGTNLEGVRRIPTGSLQQISTPAWSPDGTQIAFAGQDALSSRNLYTVDLLTGTMRQLTSGNQDDSPIWSPDGSRIVYVSARSGDYNLFLINADGSGERRLTANPAPDLMPVWSPDGRQIVFVSGRSEGYHLYLMDADTGATERLTFGGGNQSYPAWRP